MTSRRVFPIFCVILATLLAVSAAAQSVISAHSGVIQYTMGRVTVDNQLVQSRFGQFADVKENQVLRTEDGRAEVLLTPGVFLRVGENSSFRMVSNRLSDTRVEVVSGSALVEVGELLKDNSITLLYGNYTVSLLKHGLYRIDSEPAALRVYDGEARVSSGDQTLTVGHGKKVDFGGVLMATKFDTKTGDGLYRWASERAEYVAMANVSAAKSLRDNGSSWGGLGGGWMWNPWFGMFTFVPYAGTYYSPFGYSFYSPGQVLWVYRAATAPAFGGGGGYVPYRSSVAGYQGSSYYNSALGYTVGSRGSVASMGSSAGSVGSSGGGGMRGGSMGGGASSGGGARGGAVSSGGPRSH